MNSVVTFGAAGIGRQRGIDSSAHPLVATACCPDSAMAGEAVPVPRALYADQCLVVEPSRALVAALTEKQISRGAHAALGRSKPRSASTSS
jgi:hypothetical protein